MRDLSDVSRRRCWSQYPSCIVPGNRGKHSARAARRRVGGDVAFSGIGGDGGAGALGRKVRQYRCYAGFSVTRHYKL